MTTALSPESRMLATMMAPSAPQTAPDVNASMPCAATLACRSEQGLHEAAHFRRVASDGEAALFHDRELRVRGDGAARDEGAGVAHALAGRSGDAGDEADHRLGHVRLAPARRVGLVGAADLADHDHRVGARIVVEELHHVDVLEPVDRIAADADRARLAEADLRELRDRLVGERAGAADDADPALPVNVPGHDADLDLVGRDQARAVRPE